MPKGAKKRAKLKKKQQQQGHHHPDDGANHDAHGSGSGSDTNTNANNNGAASGHNLRIPTKASHHVDASEDSMESSEEMVTPRAAGSEPDEEERKAAADVPVVDGGPTGGDVGEEVMVDALSPPEPSGQGEDGGEVEVHAVVQEPEVKDVVVDEAPPEVHVQEPEVAEAPMVEVPEVEVKREVTEAPVVEVAEEVKREVAKVHPVREPEPSRDEETPVLPAVPEPEVKGVNVVVKDSTEVSRSREVDVQTTEARGPAVAVASSAHRATWWNCCGLFDAFSGSER